MHATDDLVRFARLARALEPVMQHVVVAGGWAHRLYRYRDDVQVPEYEPLYTSDTDIALPARPILPANLGQQLHDHGFVEEYLGDDNPPVTHYRLGDEDSEFYAEFLTPRFGGERRGEQPSPDTEEIAGVVAQRLRYIELLLVDPWRVDVLEPDIEDLRHPLSVQVANPVSYVAQKLLVHKKRKPEDWAKDIVYIHDTIELFAALLPELRAVWRGRLRPEMHAKSAGQVETFARSLFQDVTDNVRRAALTVANRHLEPELLRAVCHHGLEEIFGS